MKTIVQMADQMVIQKSYARFNRCVRVLHASCGMYIIGNGYFFVFRTSWKQHPFICVQSFNSLVNAIQINNICELVHDIADRRLWCLEDYPEYPAVPHDFYNSHDARVHIDSCREGYIAYPVSCPCLTWVAATYQEAENGVRSLMQKLADGYVEQQ